jgi:hypothetical protein
VSEVTTWKEIKRLFPGLCKNTFKHWVQTGKLPHPCGSKFTDKGKESLYPRIMLDILREHTEVKVVWKN